MANWLKNGERPRRYHLMKRIIGRYPALKFALEEATERFSSKSGVCGFGIGRRFKETSNRFSPKGRHPFCVKIFVDYKVARESLAPGERLPKCIEISAQGEKSRIGLDVVDTGILKLLDSASPRWPTAGVVRPGRLIAVGGCAQQPTGSFSSSSQRRIGTIGVLARVRQGNTLTLVGVTAGHVFVNFCGNSFSLPGCGRMIGVSGKQWRRVNQTAPANLRPNTIIRDAVAFRVPNDFTPSSDLWPEVAQWPGTSTSAVFDGRLASQDDVSRALQMPASTPEGMVWVEREGVSRPIFLNVEAGTTEFRPRINCGAVNRRLPLGLLWILRRVMNRPVIPGDSGSPVFIRSADGSALRLLGFVNFIVSDGPAYCIDARTTLRSLLGRFHTDYRFFQGDA